MFGKLHKNSSVKNILVFSLSNIGDVVLTCPVIDILLSDFPNAAMTLIVGSKAQSLFNGHSRIQTVVFDKRASMVQMVRWFWTLRQRHFDLIIDLRQGALALFLPCRWRTPLRSTEFAGHRRFKHLQRLKSVYPGAEGAGRLAIVPQNVPQAAALKNYVVLAPGAADSAKRWNAKGFSVLGDRLAALGRTVVFVGDANDVPLVDAIRKDMAHPSLSLAGQINLRELAFVLRHCALAVTHDSGTMHLASYFDVPIVVLWGPTDQAKYGPWSAKSVVVYRGKRMDAITAEDVLSGIAQLQ